MKNFLLGFIMLVCVSSISRAQSGFQKNIGTDSSDYFREVITTLDGGYATVGITYEDDIQGDVLLCKYDGNGDLQWSKTYDAGYSEEGYDIKQDNDGNFIILAQITIDDVNGDLDILLIKTDSFGNTIWSNIYGDAYGEEGYALDITADGNYVVTGSTDSYSAFEVWAYSLKTDTSGAELWTKTWRIPSSLSFYIGACATSDSGFVACGQRFLQANDFIIGKYSSTGVTQWEESVGSAKADFGFDIRQTKDGGYIAVGVGSSVDLASANFTVIRLNENGSIRWVKDIAAQFNNRLNSVIELADSSFILGGYTETDTSSSNLRHSACLLKLSKTGSVDWARRYGEANVEAKGYSVIESPLGGFYLTGINFSFGATTGDGYLVHVDAVDVFSGCNDTGLIVSVTDITSNIHVNAVGSDSIFTCPTSSLSVNLQSKTLHDNTICSFIAGGITENEKGHSINLFPNPATNLLTISFDGVDKNAVLEVFDVLGHRMISKKLSGDNSVESIDVSDLKAGLYAVHILNGAKPTSPVLFTKTN